MKKVFSSASLWEAREILGLLEQNRLPARLLNEHAAATPGILPFNASMSVDAEVWVLDPELEDRARRLIGEFLADRAAAARHDEGAPEWRCGGCGQPNPAGFETCWSCGGRAPGGPC